MLKKLSVSNYAIIDEIEIHFSPLLNIITGETGAGKSILIGALGLILGNRADKKVLFNNQKKCIVEGIFQLENLPLESFFTTHNLDDDDETILRREISKDGKSRAFINDTPVTLSVLRKLASVLVDLHRQHESISLSEPSFQQDVLDSFSAINSQVADYQKNYYRFKNKQNELTSLKQTEAKAREELDFWMFQQQELADLQLKENEVEDTETTLKLFKNAEDIKTTLSEAMDAFTNLDTGVTNTVRTILKNLQSFNEIDKAFAKITNRLSSVLIELEDIESEINHENSKVNFSEEEVEKLQQRNDELNRLLYKHNLNSTVDLQEKQRELEQKINRVTSYAEQINAMGQEQNTLKEELLARAQDILDKRKKAIPRLEKAVQQVLTQCGMPNSQLNVELQLTEGKQLNPNGIDQTNFLFTANKGYKPQRLKDIASGGELSRLMLAVKSVIAGKRTLPTLIFDEIDSGISGKVAMKVGRIMEKMAKNHQLITITHLPQIAACGQHHLLIYKDDSNKRALSKIRVLDDETRFREIAVMIGGENPGESSLKAAKELLEK